MSKQKKTIIIINIVFWCLVFTVYAIGYYHIRQYTGRTYYTVLENTNHEGKMVVERTDLLYEQTDTFLMPDIADCYFEIKKHWLDNPTYYTYGGEYYLEFQNLENAPLYDWSIVFRVNENTVLDSYWNGEFIQSGDYIRVTPLSHNAIINSGEKKDIGCVLLSKYGTLDFTNAVLTFHVKLAFTDFKVHKVIHFFMYLVLFIDAALFLMYFKAKEYEKQEAKDREIISQALRTFANIIDTKDEYTKGHSARVAFYSREIAKRMGLDANEQRRVFYIALLHDIGKIGIEDGILKKNGALTSEERQKVNMHVVVGGNILRDFTSIPGIADGAMYHHERYDGNGYCMNLFGEDIPLVARIIGVADAVDAMSSTRCYRNKLDMDRVIAELKAQAGKQFDPDIASIMIRMIEDKTVPVNESDIQIE